MLETLSTSLAFELSPVIDNTNQSVETPMNGDDTSSWLVNYLTDSSEHDVQKDKPDTFLFGNRCNSSAAEFQFSTTFVPLLTDITPSFKFSMKINRFNQKSFNDSDFSNSTLFCNDTENSTNLVASKLEAFALNSFLIILGVFVLCLWILFPFYVYLNKVNKERDESMPLYPITSHLYDTVKTTYITFSFLFISIILMLVTFYLKIYVAFEILHVLPMITVPTLYIITEVTQLLISLVAIRKFVIYFFPASIPKVMKVQEWMVKHLWILYAGITIKELVGVVINFVNLWKPCDEQKSSLYFPISYALTLTFHTVSSLLYVAIAVRMRIRKSTSSKKNKPQIYMVWQALIIMVFKLITITIALLLYLSSSSSRLSLYFTIFIMGGGQHSI
ncbi:hypothetical protein CAEBREN_28953 [Caenorhabditis brenneri]|uniref:Uncharacterized protein n=1 Tax=Caenorhabditis brenneri TaxID=135651 RepID=G0P2J9_CAEBE|nr:hypothetical protein CAEBREN_28953 [Caenorhabditis brenneri]